MSEFQVAHPDTEVEPLLDRVVVRPAEEEKMTAGGIHIPDVSQDKPQQGEVVSVGPGRILESGAVAEPNVEPGDRVLYGKYSGTEFSIGHDDYLILRESDILAIIRGG